MLSQNLLSAACYIHTLDILASKINTDIERYLFAISMDKAKFMTKGCEQTKPQKLF